MVDTDKRGKPIAWFGFLGGITWHIMEPDDVQARIIYLIALEFEAAHWSFLILVVIWI